MQSNNGSPKALILNLKNIKLADNRITKAPISLNETFYTQ